MFILFNLIIVQNSNRWRWLFLCEAQSEEIQKLSNKTA